MGWSPYDLVDSEALHAPARRERLSEVQLGGRRRGEPRRVLLRPLTKGFKGDLDALARKVSAVANDFRMPVQNNLLNYRRQLLGMMRAAPSYRHGDVFADMMRAVNRASERYDREALQLISPDLGPFGP